MTKRRLKGVVERHDRRVYQINYHHVRWGCETCQRFSRETWQCGAMMAVTSMMMDSQIRRFTARLRMKQRGLDYDKYRSERWRLLSQYREDHRENKYFDPMAEMVALTATRVPGEYWERNSATARCRWTDASGIIRGCNEQRR